MKVSKQQLEKLIREEILKEIGNPYNKLARLAKLVVKQYSVEKGPDGEPVVRFYSPETDDEEADEEVIPLEDIIKGFRSNVLQRNHYLSSRKH